MKMEIYTTDSNMNCGPCSLINMLQIKGSKKLEEQLSEIGRLKPFRASFYSSFLIWSKRYHKDFQIFTSTKKVSNKMFNLMLQHEKIPFTKQHRYVKLVKDNLARLNNKYNSQIKNLKNPITKINELLSKKYLIAVLTSDFYYHNPHPVPHWIVAFRKKDGKYYFMDSAAKKTEGITTLTSAMLLKGWTINQRQGFGIQLIAYKP